MKKLIQRTNRLQLLGNRILSNASNKHNLYAIPTTTYENYSTYQEQLIQEYINGVEKLYNEVERNKEKFDEFKLGPFSSQKK